MNLKNINDLTQNNTESDMIQITLEQSYNQAIACEEGALADYIPELAKVEPNHFGLALVTTRGKLYSVGDVEQLFTIQSISKAFSYALALELAGTESVRARVGIEPSGDAFNAIVFDPITGRPFNPMVNAGAIAIAGILQETYGNDAFDAVLERFSRAASRNLDMDEKVYTSEAATGHRNRAISHLLRASGALTDSIDQAVDLYFRLFSIRVSAKDLAVMAATLANLGENPVSGAVAFDLYAVRDTLAVMFSCGMYDYSGSWICDVGIPAKSGVGGGVVGVVNRQLGIGSFSPRLDNKGNSVRGIMAMKSLSNELGLHVFECTNTGSSFLQQLIS